MSVIPQIIVNSCVFGSGHLLKHSWFVGAKNSATRLHFHVAIQGRQIVKVDRMDLHLLWDNGGKLFLKPLPRFLLSAPFWQIHLRCPATCVCDQVHPRFQ